MAFISLRVEQRSKPNVVGDHPQPFSLRIRDKITLKKIIKFPALSFQSHTVHVCTIREMWQERYWPRLLRFRVGNWTCKTVRIAFGKVPNGLRESITSAWDPALIISGGGFKARDHLFQVMGYPVITTEKGNRNWKKPGVKSIKVERIWN